MKRFALFCACLLAVVTGQSRAAPLDALSPEAREELAYSTGIQAFIYAYPLLHVNQFRHLFHSPAAPSYRGPANQLNHFRELANASSKGTAASPNNDTLYTLTFMDLSEQPVIVETPDMGDRYFTIQLADFYATNFGDIGTRHNNGAAGKYLLVGPHWQGTPPPGITQVFRSPTPWAMTLLRILVDNRDELEAVHVIQDSFKLSTLDDRPLPAFDPSQLPGIPEANNPSQLWAVINRELTANPPPAADAPLVDQFAPIGIGPGQSEDISQLDPAIQRGLNRAAAAGMKIVLQAANDISGDTTYNGWGYPHPDIGDYGTDYLYRAGVTRMGLMANEPAEATYLSLYTDAQGQSLQGNQRYRLHFAADELPPAKAFWSITIYDRDTYKLVENGINRYSIGDRTEGIQFAEDGSLSITISQDTPDAQYRPNWLPAPAGEFYLIMRIYLPEDNVIAQQWQPPALEVLQ